MGHSYSQTVIYSSKERTPRAASLQYSATVVGRHLDVIKVVN